MEEGAVTYRIREVDPTDDEISETIHEFNREASPKFPKLIQDELEGHNCFWWLAYCGKRAVGFSGVVPSRLYPKAGYLKRSYVLPAHRGNGLQLRFFRARENKACKIGWTRLVSETVIENVPSANNFIRAGYKLFEPESPWARESVYWTKRLT